jgi:hypothetical protein
VRLEMVNVPVAVGPRIVVHGSSRVRAPAVTRRDFRSPWLELVSGYGPGVGVLKPSYGVPT